MMSTLRPTAKGNFSRQTTLHGQFATRSPDIPSPIHLDFLDGLRGLSALFVVLHHATGGVPREDVSRWLFRITSLLFLDGHYAVAVFIVLSGFSLMLPVVRSPDHRLRGGFLGYLKRCAWRILPVLLCGPRFLSGSDRRFALPSVSCRCTLGHCVARLQPRSHLIAPHASA